MLRPKHLTFGCYGTLSRPLFPEMARDIHADSVSAGTVIETRAIPFHGQPWKAIPGHFGPPWFMPAVGAWHRLQEVLH